MDAAQRRLRGAGQERGVQARAQQLERAFRALQLAQAFARFGLADVEDRAEERRLRNRPGIGEISTLVCYAFDYRTRLGPFLFADKRLLTAGPRAVASALVNAGISKTRIVLRQWNPNFRTSEARIDGKVPEMLLVSSMQIHSASAYEMITGRRHPQPGERREPGPDDFPHIGAIAGRLRRDYEQGSRAIFANTRTSRWIGNDMVSAAAGEGMELEDFVLEVFDVEFPEGLMVYRRGDTPDQVDEMVRRTFSHPRMMVASDGIYYGPHAHPRGYGCFARALRKPVFLTDHAGGSSWMWSSGFGTTVGMSAEASCQLQPPKQNRRWNGVGAAMPCQCGEMSSSSRGWTRRRTSWIKAIGVRERAKEDFVVGEWHRPFIYLAFARLAAIERVPDRPLGRDE